MKYVPQAITCPNCNCNHSGMIITEDIPKTNLVPQINPDGRTDILAQIRCPECNGIIQIAFVFQRQVGDEILYECETQPNKGLQMWLRLVDGNLKSPVFRPVTGNRSPFEQTLDSRCQTIADLLHKWKSPLQPGQDLEEILGEVEDYTKKVSWKEFKARHYVVNICAEDESNNSYVGFSGRFDVVKNKNPQLIDAFLNELIGVAGDKSNQFCENPIGQCAEMHAANRCLNYENAANLPTLRFSIAYTCRHGSSWPKSYCMNCITLFALSND